MAYFWDFLRPLSDVAIQLDIYIKALVFLLALGMFILSVSAYWKTRSRKFVFVSAAFFLFAVKWLLKMSDIFVSPGAFFPDASENVFELLIFASLFLAVFRK